MTLRGTLFTAAFAIFLVPVVEDGLSVNYSFVLLPLLYLMVHGKVRRPHGVFLLLMMLYTMIFIIAFVYQYALLDQGLRRVISFLLFMSMFSYLFLNIDKEMIQAFKLAVVVISVLFSMYSVYLFLALGASNLGFEAKILLGSQRFGFIYLMGIWLTYLHQGLPKRYAVIRYMVLLILLCGLLLTFSRSSIVGLLGSIVIFALIGTWRWARRPNIHSLLKAIVSVAGVALLIVILNLFAPVAFSFFDTTLFSFLRDSDAVGEDLGNPYSTGGTRVYLLGRVLDFVAANPVTGSGYLGIWILGGLSEFAVASAHNQLWDALFRTGWLGFLAYICLLFLVGSHLYRHEQSLFWGFLSVVIYGMFHETFKESQGGFALAFLIGLMSQSFGRRGSLVLKQKWPHPPRNSYGTSLDAPT